MPKLMAFKDVPLKEGPMETQVEHLFVEEFERAIKRWGITANDDGDASSWAVSSLAMGYLRHCWKTGRADDPRAYLEAVHRVSGLYLEQFHEG